MSPNDLVMEAEPVPAEPHARLDRQVEQAGAAARAFRRLDQEAVDRIVRAMVIAGLEHVVELAELAIEETGFGVFEDKVIKNLMATETLSDYLEGKRTVGVIFEDPARAIAQIAERRPRAAADHQPDLDGAVEGDHRREDP